MAKYFSCNPTGGGDGFETAETAEEAQSRARTYLNIARDFASREGWDEDTAGICWGVICEEAVFHENQEYIPPDAYEVGDYRMESTGPSEEVERDKLRKQLTKAQERSIQLTRELVEAANERDALAAELRDREDCIDALRERLDCEYRAMLWFKAGIIENPENIRTVRKLVRAAVFAFKELNTIRARDGVPYTSNGYQSSVKPEYFSSVVDMLDDAVKEATGKSAHCHPELHSHIDLP